MNLANLIPSLFPFILAALAFLIFPVVARRSTPALNRRIGKSKIIDRIFIVVVLSALVGLSARSVHSFDSFGSYHDFVGFDGVLQSMLRGAEITIAYRFNPILYSLVPLYALWDDPRILLVLVSAGLAAAAFPLYWFAREQIGKPLALCLAVAYLVSPALETVNQAVFYEIKLAVPLFSFALFFLLRRHYVPFLICLGLAMTLKQEIALSAVGFAAFIFLVQRNFRLGVTLFGIGTGAALIVILFLYPSLQGGVYPVFRERYAYLGNSLSEMLTTLLFRPQIALEHLLIPRKIDFIFSLLRPLAFLPIIGLEVFAISLPVWAYTLLSDLPQQTDPAFYYIAPLIPFLYFSAAVGIRRLLGWVRSTERARAQFALGALLIGAAQLYVPANWLRVFDPSSFVLDDRTRLGHEILQKIPAGASVTAQPEFFMNLYVARKIQVHEFSPNGDYRFSDYLIGDTMRAWYKFQQDAWESWRASGFFDSVVEADGYFLLRRRPLPALPTTLDNGWKLYRTSAQSDRSMVDNGVALIGFVESPNSFLRIPEIKFGNSLALIGFTRMPSGSWRGGDSVRVLAEWRAEENGRDRFTILFHLVDSRGHVWAQEEREPIVSTDRWRIGDIVRDQFNLTLPRTMPPGEYAIKMAFWEPRGEARLNALDAQGRGLGIEPIIANVRIEKDTRNIPADYLQIEQPLRVDMQEIRLLGSTEIPKSVAVGETIPVGLYWRAREKPRGDYVVTLQLRDSNNRVVLEQTDVPAAGAYPTRLWQVGEVLLDWHDLALPASLLPGNYDLLILLQKSADHSSLGETKIGQLIVRK